MIAIIAALLAAPAFADPVSNAFTMCKWLDSVGMASAPCDVDGMNVIITLHMSPGDARGLCPQVARVANENGLSFDAGWKLMIRSPYSGENSIAFCDL